MPLENYCPNCDAAVSPTAQSCGGCGASFGEGSAWKPSARPKVKDKPRVRITFLSSGVFIAFAFPVFAAMGFGLWALMPGCTGGSSGPPSGCVLLGIGLNWFISLTTLAFLGSFLSVPLGLLVIAVGVVVKIFRAK